MQNIEKRLIGYKFLRKNSLKKLKALDNLESIRIHLGCGLNTPKGAFYFFPNVTSYFGKRFNGQVISNASDLSMYLLDHGHIAVVPGDAFGNPNCIRISYATSDEILTTAMKRIGESLAKLTE